MFAIRKKHLKYAKLDTRTRKKHRFRQNLVLLSTMSIKAKSPKDSFTIMNELVLPNDTNTLNNLMGGRLLHWMDIAAAISAQKHCNRIVVTAS